VRRVAESFSWPFRAQPSTWTWGIVSVVLLPLMFVPLLGYGISATRSAELDPDAGPPPWRFSFAHFWAGGWTFLLLAVIAAPFAALLKPVADWLSPVTHDFAYVLAILVIALPWGLVMLLLVPHATAAFASSGDPHDLFDVAGSLRGVRRDFATWNAVVAAIVTAWALGLACAGLLCVGIVPGVFYAILVSAHAAATLHPAEGPTQGPSTR
jgi:uncharacterized protein DUF4013